MRFLLNPSKSAALKRVTKARSNRVVATNRQQPPTGSAINHIPRVEDSSVRVFGQQCSPQCGCAVRFEATYEAGGGNRITSMTYDAKTVVTRHHVSNVDGVVELQPVYTTSQHKPLLKECNCNTIHSLASSIVQMLPNMTLSQAQNQLEFKGARASPSFRYTVLKNNNLLKKGYKNSTKNCFEKTIINVNGGHCFDLIEEALVACLKGYMPKPRNTVYNRRVDIQFEKPNQLINEFDRNLSNNESGLDPLRFVNAAKKRTAKLLKLSSSFPNLRRSSNVGNNNMPQFHLMGMDDSPNNTLRELQSELEYVKRLEKKDVEMMDDWLNYIDEIEESEGNA